jgi:hypothetical protein
MRPKSRPLAEEAEVVAADFVVVAVVAVVEAAGREATNRHNIYTLYTQAGSYRYEPACVFSRGQDFIPPSSPPSGG